MMTLTEIELMARERQRDLRAEQARETRTGKSEATRTPLGVVLGALAAILASVGVRAAA